MSVLHPNQFEVNDAWIVFQLNDAPVRTERDGTFNCIALMDAASCFIFGTVLILADKLEPSELELRRLLKKGWKAKRQYPKTLFVPAGRFQNVLPAEAERQGIAVVPVRGGQLRAFIGEAKQGFKAYLQAGDANSPLE